MKLSVIIPNYNKANFIEETISSLAKNHIAGVEWIAVDDNSTDGSWELLENLIKEHKQLKLYRNPGKGGSSARNFGLSKANGEFVIFLDSDDLLAENCIENRLALTQTFPNYDAWVMTMAVFENQPGDRDLSMSWVPKKNEDELLKCFLKHDLQWTTVAPIWRKSFIEKVGGFDESFPRLQDVEFHTKCLLAGARVRTFPEKAADCYYRISANRHSFKGDEFHKNYIAGAIMYYRKFEILVPHELKQFLAGTLLETLSAISHQHRIGSLSKSSYIELSRKLIETCSIKSQTRWLGFYAWIQSKFPFHIKGLKKATQLLLGL
ncbi:glycosyltransferase family 2 protein [Halocola ammonii]